MLSRNKCELLAEYFLDGVGLRYDIGLSKPFVKNIPISYNTYYGYNCLKQRLLSSCLAPKPNDEVYWIWFESLTEFFYIIENESDNDDINECRFNKILETADKNIEKRKKWEEIAYV